MRRLVTRFVMVILVTVFAASPGWGIDGKQLKGDMEILRRVVTLRINERFPGLLTPTDMAGWSGRAVYLPGYGIVVTLSISIPVPPWDEGKASSDDLWDKVKRDLGEEVGGHAPPPPPQQANWGKDLCDLVIQVLAENLMKVENLPASEGVTIVFQGPGGSPMAELHSRATDQPGGVAKPERRDTTISIHSGRPPRIHGSAEARLGLRESLEWLGEAQKDLDDIRRDFRGVVNEFQADFETYGSVLSKDWHSRISRHLSQLQEKLSELMWTKKPPAVPSLVRPPFPGSPWPGPAGEATVTIRLLKEDAHRHKAGDLSFDQVCAQARITRY